MIQNLGEPDKGNDTPIQWMTQVLNQVDKFT